LRGVVLVGDGLATGTVNTQLCHPFADVGAAQRRQRNVAEHRLDVAARVALVLGNGLVFHIGHRGDVLGNEALDGVAVTGGGRLPDPQSLTRAQPVAQVLEPKRLGMIV
jgi:hypothetical protein